MKKKIAFIIQRYGPEINGGAEQHCRQLAERLTAHYHVDVLTSCANSYKTWDNFYPEGTEIINGVNVLRFRVLNSRSKDRNTYKYIRRRKPFQKVLRFLGLIGQAERFFPNLSPQREDFKKWLTEQGCPVPGLISYLKQNHHDYKVLIFFTYLYYPTVLGLEVAPAKSILVPTAHDEPAIYIPFFQRVFNLPSKIIYNTLEEKRFVNALFDNSGIDSAIAGIGVQIPDIEYINIKEFCGIKGHYLVYLGRVEEAKGCKILIDYFKKYKTRNSSDLKLILAGEKLMEIPEDVDIISLGFVSDNTKYNLLEQADCLIMPSFYESLSMVTLEAMKLKTPVIVNGQCSVLRHHINESRGGFDYTTYSDFEMAIKKITGNESLRITMGKAGEQYVTKNYNWTNIIKIFLNKIEAYRSFNNLA